MHHCLSRFRTPVFETWIMRPWLMNLSIFKFWCWCPRLEATLLLLDFEHFQSVFYFVPNNTAGSTKLYLSRQLVQQEHHLHCAIIFHIPIPCHPNPYKLICWVRSCKVAEPCVWCHLRLKSVRSHIINFDKKKVADSDRSKSRCGVHPYWQMCQQIFHWWSFISTISDSE